MTEDEMIGWHHRLSGHEFKQILGGSEGQGGGAGAGPQALATGVPQPFPGQLLKGGAKLALPSSCRGVSQGEMWASDPVWRKRCLCF